MSSFCRLLLIIQILLAQLAARCAVAQMKNSTSKSKTRVKSQERVDWSELILRSFFPFFFWQVKEKWIRRLWIQAAKMIFCIGWLGSSLEIQWRAQSRAATPTWWKECFWHLVRIPPGCLVVFFHTSLWEETGADLGSGCGQDCLDLLPEALIPVTWISGWKMITKVAE